MMLAQIFSRLAFYAICSANWDQLQGARFSPQKRIPIVVLLSNISDVSRFNLTVMYEAHLLMALAQFGPSYLFGCYLTF
jgi:hypothetical protein